MSEMGWKDPWKNQCLIDLSYIYHAEIIASLLPGFYSKELKLLHIAPPRTHLKSSHLSHPLIVAIVLLLICAFLSNFMIWHQTTVDLLTQFLSALFSWISLAHRASLTSNSLLLRYRQFQVVCFGLHYYCLNYSSFQGPHRLKGYGLF